MAFPASVLTLVDLFEFSAATHATRDLFGTKTGERWVYASYGEVKKFVDRLRGGLASLGVGPNDKVGIIANNRQEWAIAAYATYGLGGAFVPMYESQLDKDWAFIIHDSGIKVLFVSTPAIYQKTKNLPGTIPTLEHVVTLFSGEGSLLSYAELLRRGDEKPAPLVRPAERDAAAVLYTSGTTGDPKGVLLSHGNVMSNVRAVQANLPVDGTDRSLAFLPWAHSFGHTGELHLVISIGASMGICESTDKILPYLAEVKPTVIFAVPRIFNRIYAGVQKQMENRPAPVRALFEAGLRAARMKSKGQPIGLRASLFLLLAEKLVFARVRARFGGRLKYAVSGAAALATEVATFVDALGITVYEGYGLTETSPVVAVNLPNMRRIGSVGKPIPGVKVVIDKTSTADGRDGEIVVYGPNVMQGYYKRPEETRAVMTADGGFRTGDLGYFDEEGYLYISGRIKEQYKLENGKFVVPAPLEEELKLSPFIANVMIYGDNKPFNVALVAPNLDAIKEWAAHEGIANGEKELVGSEKVRAKIKAEIDRLSSTFKGYERVRAFTLVSEDFTMQNDLLTPKLSIKRHNILKKWGKDIERLYGA
jgi:long-chain acyl-CoA synthetase